MLVRFEQLAAVSSNCFIYCEFRVECLTRLSLNCTLTVSECIGPISNVLENMLLVSRPNRYNESGETTPL